MAHLDRYNTKKGERWRVRYRYGTGVRTKAGFRAFDDADDWADRLERARSAGQLDDFLAGLLDDRPELTLRDLMVVYFDENGYDQDDGLARATWYSYQSSAETHIYPHVGDMGAQVFATTAGPLKLQQKLRDAKVPKPSAERARKVLSAALSWAVQSRYLPANGALLLAAESKTRRRSGRRARGAVGNADLALRGPKEKAWALEPKAVATLVAAARARTVGRPGWFAERDAFMIELLYGLGARPQEILGPIFSDHAGGFLAIEAVLSQGELTGPKTTGSVRMVPLMPYIDERLAQWREFLREQGLPASDDDFIIPGRDTNGHMTESQQHSWSQRSFKPICNLAIEGDDDLGVPPHKELGYLKHATPYSLRRGMISLRIMCRGRLWDGPNAPENDSATVARDCGTSIKVLSDRYAKALRLEGSRTGTPEAHLRQALGVPDRPALRLVS